MNLSKLAVSKPMTTLIGFILAVALGIYCIFSLPVDMFPEMDIPYIIVYTSYSNAGPEEVENSVTRTLESTLSGVSGLKKITSRSSTGTSIVILEFEYGTNLNTAGNDIRDKIELVRNYLPDDANSPMTIRMDPSMMPIMTLVLTGTRTPAELGNYADEVIQPRLEQIDGVASAYIMGGREKAILVDVPRDRLDAYQLTLSQIAQMIGAQNITSSGGNIEQGDYNYSISAKGTYESVEDIKQTVITYKASSASGKTPEMVSILLRDIADVYEGYKDSTSEAYLESTPCVMLSVSKQSGKNSVATAKKMRKELEKIKKELPNDIEIVETSNSTDQIENTIKEVVFSLLLGVVLSLIVLFIFLRNIKSTLVVGISMPVSVVITMLLMYFKGLTINMMSLTGLLLGIGMLVDNSIVILENIYSYQERDTKPTVAAVLGSQEMIGAITGSTLTSVCIFLPMIMFNKQLGMMGKLFNDFAFTIVFSLLCSLFSAIVLVPILTSKFLKTENVNLRQKGKILGAFDSIMNRFFSWLDAKYANAVRTVLHHKKMLALVLICLLAVAVAMVIKLGFIFIPNVASTTVQVDLTMPQGTTLSSTREVIEQLRANVLKDLVGVKYTTMSVGGNSMLSTSSSSNTANLIITLYKRSERKKGWDDEDSAKKKIRQYFNSFPNAQFAFGSSGNQASSGSGVDIAIKSDDLEACRRYAKEIKALLAEKASDMVSELDVDMKDGLPELKIVLDRNRMAELGVTSYAVGAEINAAINGKTVSRYDDNGTQIDIVIGLPDTDKKKFSDLEQIYVANSMGKRIPLASFARYEESFAPVTIYRENQTRAVHVTGKPTKGIPITKINKAVQGLIKESIIVDDGVLITFGGDFADALEALIKFGIIILMAVFLVFAVMVSQFESFKDPFIVLFTIPLSFIGVATIYFITNTIFNVVTIIGMLVLVGTIVNNGIVLVDYTNLLRKRGMSLEDACVESARNRLRPILMSTLTTIISLIPMAFFPGEGGGMTQPIGLTVFGGMSFGSLMTLFLMPALYLLFNRKAEKKRLKALQDNTAAIAQIKAEIAKENGGNY